MLLQILVICYYANEVTIVSDKITTTLFHSAWENKDPKFRTSMIIFMENAKQPIKVTSLKIFDVNLETFKTICHSAYSLYAVLQRIN